MIKRKALIIGIDKYKKPHALKGCTTDAKVIGNLFEKNFDESCNFSTKLLLDNSATRKNIISYTKKVFSGDQNDIGLFYFSGHGCDDGKDGSIVAIDGLISFEEIMNIVSESDCTNKVIILDCCFSGKLGNSGIIGDKTIIKKDTVILTACAEKESALLENGRSTFSLLLQSGLEGGAANILGDITPGSLYAYIDEALGAWDQRPFFKAHVSSFASLRKCAPRVTQQELHKAMKLFKNPKYLYPLKPSYEFTNSINYKTIKKQPYANKNDVTIFKMLQKLNRNGLVDPVCAEHMYFAAMNSKSCKLTKLGKHYWKLCNDKKI